MTEFKASIWLNKGIGLAFVLKVISWVVTTMIVSNHLGKILASRMKVVERVEFDRDFFGDFMREYMSYSQLDSGMVTALITSIILGLLTDYILIISASIGNLNGMMLIKRTIRSFLAFLAYSLTKLLILGLISLGWWLLFAVVAGNPLEQVDEIGFLRWLVVFIILYVMMWMLMTNVFIKAMSRYVHSSRWWSSLWGSLVYVLKKVIKFLLINSAYLMGWGLLAGTHYWIINSMNGTERVSLVMEVCCILFLIYLALVLKYWWYTGIIRDIKGCT